MKRKINILHISNELGLGGGTRAILTFCKYSNKKKFNIHICSINNCAIPSRISNIHDISIVQANGEKEFVVKYINDNNIDIIHFHRSGHFEPIHNYILDNCKGIKLETNIFGKFDATTYESFDTHFTVSNFSAIMRYYPMMVKNKLKLPPQKLACVPNPVDTDFFIKHKFINSDDKNRLKLAHRIKDDELILGKIGCRPAIEKWSDDVFKFIDYLPKTFKFKLLLQGVPENKIRYIQNNYSDKIVILPQLADDELLIKYYDLLDISIHITKLGESFGYSISEAMSRGLPVIVNSTPHKDNAQLEQVINNKTGLVANYPQTIAQAVLYLAEDKSIRDRLGKNSINFVKENFDAKIVTQKLEDIYLFYYYKKPYKDNKELFINYKKVKYYNHMYMNLLNKNFGKLDMYNKIQNFIRIPNNILAKIKDYIYFKYKIII